MTKKNDRKSSELKEKIYEEAMVSRYNKDYHEPPTMIWQSDNFAKFVSNYCKKGDRILDLGCGPASMWPHWNKFLEKPKEIVGVDFSEGMVEESRRLFPGDDFRVGSFYDIPAVDGSFDVVIVSSAFHHIKDEYLPEALMEIKRVLDEHGVLIGREPLVNGRLGDRGGWLASAVMNMRHLAYRLTDTRENPEPDPGPAHHAYDAEEFLDIIEGVFTTTNLKFMHPVSHFLARVRHPIIAQIAKQLDESVEHLEGQEIFYVAHKNYSDSKDVIHSVRKAIKENHIHDFSYFLAEIKSSAKLLDLYFQRDQGQGLRFKLRALRFKLKKKAIHLLSNLIKFIFRREL